MSVFSKVYENIWKEVTAKEEYSNLTTNQFLTTLFYSTVISSFSWGGDIPEFIKPLPSYIEESLFMSSKIAFFEHEGDWYITPCYPMGVLKENGMYTQYTCIFRNGKQVIKSYEEIEICNNNSLGIPSRVIVEEILDKCIDSLRAVDMSLERASTPSLNFCSDERVLNLIRDAVAQGINHHNPLALINSSSFKGDTLHKYDLFDNRAQDVLALWDIFVRYKNLFFSTFGVNNVEISKSERLTRAEGESNTEMIRYTLFNDLYLHRVDWIKRIKEHFNKTLTIEINRNYETVTALTMDNEDKREMSEQIIAPYLSQVEQEEVSEKEGEANDVEV